MNNNVQLLKRSLVSKKGYLFILARQELFLCQKGVIDSNSSFTLNRCPAKDSELLYQFSILCTATLILEIHFVSPALYVFLVTWMEFFNYMHRWVIFSFLRSKIVLFRVK